MNQKRDLNRFGKAALTAAIVVTVPWSRPAHAADDADANKAAAQALLVEGNALLQKGQPAEALEKFTQARRAFPSPKIFYNIGQAQGLIPGRETQAYEAMSRFLDEAKDASPELRTAAEAQRQRVRPRIGLVFVTADPLDGSVLVDGEDVGRASLEVPLVLASGVHKLALRMDATTSAEETISVTGGETFKVQLRVPLPALAVAPPSPPSVPSGPVPSAWPSGAHSSSNAVAAAITTPPPWPATSERGWDWRRATGLGLMALGAASLAVGIVEHVKYFQKAEDFRSSGCGTNDLTAHPGCSSLKSQFDSAHSWFIAGYAGAAVLGASGAYLFWITPVNHSVGADGGSIATAGRVVTFDLEGHF